MKLTSAERPNRRALAKSAEYLQSFMLFLAETEKDEIEDDGKGPIFFTLQRHGPIPIAIDRAYFRPPIRLAGHSL